VPRFASVIIDAVLATALAAYLLLIATDFMASFQSFVQLATIGLAAWAGVVLVWIFSPRRPAGSVDWVAVLAWLAAVTVGLLFSASPLFVGPLASGIFAVSGLSYLLSLGVAAVGYAVLSSGRRS